MQRLRRGQNKVAAPADRKPARGKGNKVTVQFLATRDQYELIVRSAAACGLSAAAYVRLHVLRAANVAQSPASSS